MKRRGDGGSLLLVVPRPGTISPWSSKATDIARNCGLAPVKRVERGIGYRIATRGGSPLRDAERAALLPLVHDRMTEAVLGDLDDARALFSHFAPKPLATISLLAPGARRNRARQRGAGPRPRAGRDRLSRSEFPPHRPRPDRRRTDDVRAGQFGALPAQDLQRELDRRWRTAGKEPVRDDSPHPRDKSAGNNRRLRRQRGRDRGRDGAAVLSGRRRPLSAPRRADAPLRPRSRPRCRSRRRLFPADLVAWVWRIIANRLFSCGTPSTIQLALKIWCRQCSELACANIISSTSVGSPPMRRKFASR